MKTIIIIISIFIASYCFAGEIFVNNHTYTVPFYTYKIAVGDLNNDNRPDIVAIHTPASYSIKEQILIFYQTRYQDFLEPVSLASGNRRSMLGDIKIADVNGDRHNDLLILNQTLGYLGVYYQDRRTNSLNVETIYSLDNFVHGKIRIADLNNDKLKDVVCWTSKLNPGGSNAIQTVIVFLQDKKTKSLKKHGSFQVNSSQSAELGDIGSVELGDMDNDGITDIVVIGGRPRIAINEIYVFDKDGKLKQTIDYKGYNYYHFKIADIDKDGDQDIIIPIYFRRRVVAILTQNKGKFKETKSLPFYNLLPQQVEIGDLNEDGLPDILVKTHKNVLAYLNKGSDFELADSFKYISGGDDIEVKPIIDRRINDILILGHTPNEIHAFLRGLDKEFKHLPKLKPKGILQAIESVTKADLPEKAKALEVLEKNVDLVSKSTSEEIGIETEELSITTTEATNKTVKTPTNNSSIVDDSLVVPESNKNKEEKDLKQICKQPAKEEKVITTIPKEVMTKKEDINTQEIPKGTSSRENKEKIKLVKNESVKTSNSEQKTIPERKPVLLNILYVEVLPLQFDRGIRLYKDGSYIKYGDVGFPEMFKFYKPWEEKEESKEECK